MELQLIKEGNSWLVILDDLIIFESHEYQEAKNYYNRILKGEAL